MANTNPVADTAGVVEQIYRLGKNAGICDVNPIGAVTKGLNGEQLSEIGAMAESIARVRIFSDDGNCVADPLIMRRALEYVKTYDGIIAQHAQEPRLTVNSQMNEGIVSAKIGLTGWPAVAEEAIIARDILLTDHVQSRLHICHVTTAGGVELVRWAKQRGALSVVIKTMIETKLLTWEELSNRMSIKPAQIAGYSNQGQKIAQGSVANLVLFDPNANWIVDRNNMKTKSKNTPFDQMQLPGKITDVIYAGNLVLKSGKLISLESTRND